MATEAKKETVKRLTASMVTIIVLSLCLVLTTFALVYAMVSVEDNLFVTGTVKINLNDGVPVIQENDFLFEPGATVKREFFIENESTCDIYYRLYFENVSGGLSDILQVTICDGEKVLFKGTPNALSRTHAQASDDLLPLHGKRPLQIYFHFPEDVGNEAQNLFLSFELAAEAVQARNNPNKEFQ